MFNKQFQNLLKKPMVDQNNEPLMMNRVLADWILNYGTKDRFMSYKIAEELYDGKDIVWDPIRLRFVKEIVENLIGPDVNNPGTILTIPVREILDSIVIESKKKKQEIPEE